MKRLISLCLFGCSLLAALAQNPEAELAEKYFADEEFESALGLYEKLHRSSGDEKYALRIVSCFEALQQFEEADKFLNKVIKRSPNSPIFPITQAMLYEKTGNFKDADKLYDQTIEKELQTEGDFLRIGAFLYQAGKLDLALKTYLQGRKRLKRTYEYSSEIANIYEQQGEFGDATDEYLNDYYRNPTNYSSVNLSILNMVVPASMEPIERALLAAVDKRQNDRGLRTMLYEYYVLAEDFPEAFVQVKSIDRVFREDGELVFPFAETMRTNGNYELSNRAYDYIIERTKNPENQQRAYMEKAINGELKAFQQVPVDLVAIKQAVQDYGELLDQFDRSAANFDAIYRRARLMVFYLEDLNGALTELNGIVDNPGIPREKWAQAKLLIGDVLLMQQEYNKAKLTFTQVSDMFKDRQMGALAKYKLAQLAYYKGEFNLAQAQLSAIKDNTSNDISNDAIKLNLIIIDNTGLDTSTVALELFAQAQLLAYQRLYDRSMTLLDSLAYTYPTHTLADEILWEKANIFLKQNDINAAMVYIDRILAEFPLDIYGDDALYTKARIYDFSLKDPEAAMKYYMEFLVRFPGSLYSVDVRKRIRALRAG